MEILFNLRASSEQAPVDFESALKGLEGDVQLLEAVVQMLLNQIDVDLTSIQAEVAANNSNGLADSSRRLKGSLGAIVAVPAYLACTALNRSARSGAIASYLPGLLRLEHELARLRPFLDAWIIEQANYGF